MNFSDIIFVAQWWLVLFIIGLVFLPLTSLIFSNFFDRGYIFARILGMALISYVVFLLGILKVLPFTELTISLVIFSFLIPNILISKYLNILMSLKKIWRILVFEELLFLLTLFFWSYIRSHQPEIHGLEKYMDFGFVNSIMRSQYFPPVDMWFPPLSINYYYFGHLITAILTKISTIPSFVTYNLMLSTIFAFTFTGAFSIGLNLFNTFLATTETQKKNKTQKNKFSVSRIFSASVVAGLLSGFLVSLAGNLHTIYTFFKPYVNENPVPFWQLPFAFDSFPNGYWYPNATRFIHNTIHEFPIYSAVVSDLHGHYLDVPFVLLTIAVLFSLILNFANKNASTQNSKLKTQNYNSKLEIFNLNRFAICDLRFAILLGFILAIMYMTNAWDGIIYFLLTTLVLATLPLKKNLFNFTEKNQISNIKNQKYIFNIYYLIFTIFIIGAGFFIFALPFNLYFKPFASGIGVLCAPEFLTKMGNFGPFLFEADHCQRSPIWQLAILYGFFYFWAISFIIFLFKNSKFEARSSKQYQMTKIQNSKLSLTWSKRFEHSDFENSNLSFDSAQDGEPVEPFRISKFGFRISTPDVFILILIFISTFLILLPEFIYVKDIYPGHYRANTMFKLVYQAFIMLSIASGYIIVRTISNIKYQISNIFYSLFFIFSILFFILVMIYPYFAINSYYNLKTYQGLDGIKYLKPLYPTDYEGILWINKNIKGQPVILEAQGDSYTDYGRVSTNTGLPTVLGWTVHEWLWRGTYDIPAPRIPEVQKMYESEDLEETKSLLKKYKVELVFFGDLERQKYPKLNEGKFKSLGKVIYENGNTRIYKVD